MAFHGSRMAYWILGIISKQSWRSTFCGKKENVKRGFDYLFNTQLNDGAWWGQLGSAVPLDEGLMHFSSEDMDSGNRTKDTNFAAYIATAVWHDYLLNNNLDFVKTAWPHVKKAI